MGGLYDFGSFDVISRFALAFACIMFKAASETIAFVPYLLQNVLPWCMGWGPIYSDGSLAVQL